MWISNRSEAIVTYALCGFANLSSMGIVLGGMGSIKFLKVMKNRCYLIWTIFRKFLRVNLKKE